MKHFVPSEMGSVTLEGIQLVVMTIMFGQSLVILSLGWSYPRSLLLGTHCTNIRVMLFY